MSSRKSLSELGNSFSVTIPVDADGYLDRECPNTTCLGFFKVKPGTGLKDGNECTCPYCAYRAPHDQFYAPAQVEYARNVASQEASQAVREELRSALRGANSKFLKVTIDQSQPEPPVYPHVPLPTKLICASCSCDFKITGVVGYCPDCGRTNE